MNCSPTASPQHGCTNTKGTCLLPVIASWLLLLMLLIPLMLLLLVDEP
jgi:hypothetical protein